ncbi:hypothetical protein MHU86_11179 [Fragilaria crotonensis]|nr:hypothetical protein MHU86_11179 [Fragilaria crotonensis]
MIRINLHHSQLEAGVGQPLLENPSYEIPYLTPCWILSLRKFLATHNATITITDQPQLSLKTDSDAFIMQQSHLARYSTAHQRDLNLVRMYLQVTSLADLTDPGRLSAIHTDFLNGRRPPHWKTHHIWPRQEAPSAHQRRLWKRYITSSFLRYIPFWKTPPTSSTPSTPTGERPTSKKVEMAPTSFPTIRDYLATLSRTQRRLVEDVTQVATDLQVWRAFRSRERLYIASDGGLSGNEGTFGWVISTRKFPLFQCGGPVDGPFDTNSSTRSELAGFASSLLFITGLARYWGLKHRSRFKWITDSKAALSKVRLITRRGWRATRQPNEADLLSIIASLLQELRCKVVYAWIKGHQDRLNSYDSLPFLVRLNVSADFLATRYRLRGKLKSSQRVDHDPSQKISISIHGCRLTSQYDDCLRFHINGYHLRQYIQDKRKWSDKVWDDVDFDILVPTSAVCDLHNAPSI